jgi:8-oxo-dGTP pyrophosphatase MutT (NUDIX family)
MAAAIEAEEEAGVRGAVQTSPLGSYRYRKRRRNRASLMLEVEVFALAVTMELDRWKEQRERKRRWFTLPEAADAVEESDLAALIRGFDPAGLDVAADGTILDAGAGETRVPGPLARLKGLLR